MSATQGERPGSRPTPNAICAGGPYDGMLARIDQDVGIVQVHLRPDDRSPSARYRITAGRVHHPSCSHPFVVLRWVGDDQADGERH
ncbi:hypothetical protein [Nonomuraea jiangxiensis]|uniref:Uncharacterized protein n=1 Tax=Nonomuraea jiangxiensis TaxID=633440 RepID=A0A1G9MNI0_9ACTN|nr:hypothetical protein [Nonomuraea jiangxiensis]SDL75800.1 hypothetical protein SAMN05421869_13068 [Nonomuraea jiangxiensis]